MAIHPYYTIKPTELIGLKFKRKKYGLSKWTDVIKRTEIYLEYNPDFKEYCAVFKIYGEGFHGFDIDEIVILEIEQICRPKREKQISDAIDILRKEKDQRS